MAKEINSIIKILMERDEMSQMEAEDYLKEEVAYLSIEGDSYEDLEEMLRSELGLEPDYIMDLVEFIENECN